MLHNARKYDIEVSVYGTVTRGMIRIIAEAVRDSGCGRLSARVRRLSPLRRHLPRLGFTYEGVTRQYFGRGRDNDALRYGILIEEWQARHG